jgi:hypothetical protein
MNISDSGSNDGEERQLSYEEAMAQAGKIIVDTPEMWGKGIINDIKRTVGTHWVEEMTNFNQKTIAVTLLLFISVIAPTLTFGAVYAKETSNYMGPVETILATTWVGVAYSLIGGMPLCVIGSTGPVLAFTKAVVSISKNLDVPFAAMYGWISVWLLFYAFTAAFFDLTRYVRIATRFTDEVFATLIVSIFVLDAVGDPFSQVGILRYFQPTNKAYTELHGTEGFDYIAVALLSSILGFGTTSTIFFFRGFKTSSFFCSDTIRTSVHDFAVTFSVVAWSMVKIFLFPYIPTEKMKVPDKFEPTFQCCDDTCTSFFPDDCLDQEAPARARGWVANLGDINGKAYVPVIAIALAVPGFILLFLDNGITWHLVNHKSHKVRHGEAYNYDLCLSGLFNFINGMLGLPWLVATTVPCIIHLNSLADKDKDGKFISVQETRLTMFFSHLLVGLSLLFLGVLKLLPMPVLYGVFLFMGLSSLPNLQFWNRFLLFFQQPSKYPQTVYTRLMEKNRIHLYTILEMFCFGLVFLVQNFKQISIVFPLMTLLLIPARNFVLPKFMEGWELVLLDGDDEEINKLTPIIERHRRGHNPDIENKY